MPLRRSEWVAVAYFGYVALLYVALPVPMHVTLSVCGLNLLALGNFWILSFAYSLRRSTVFDVLRDMYPGALLPLAYREMGWFRSENPGNDLERSWVVWDRWLLSDLGAKRLIESMGPLAPAILEFSYLMVYLFTPICFLLLCAHRCRRLADSFFFAAFLGAFLSYALFPFFPSVPPRLLFPGDCLPTGTNLFRDLNLAIVGSMGIRTSVFPSAHVSAAFACAFAMRRLLPGAAWVGRTLIATATLIAIATVYGRYHYAVDAVAGFGVGLAAEALAKKLAPAPPPASRRDQKL
jgi:membrane-associated phospholipid phosphatase